jgi:hypothetical protein
MRFFGVNVLAAVGFLSGGTFGAMVPSEEVPNEDCSNLSVPIWKETTGAGDDFPFDEAMVAITSQSIDEVTFSVSQIWNENGLPMISVHYRTLEGDDHCSMNHGRWIYDSFW